MEWSYVLAGLVLAFLALHYYLTYTNRYWKKQSVPCIEGFLPGLGEVLPLIIKKKNMSQLVEDFYNDMQGFSMVGFHIMRTPVLLLRNPELVRTVLSKDFHSFEHNDAYFDPDLDPLNAANPFFSSGEQWKISRGQLTAAFTRSKLKFMVGSVSDVCSKMTKYLNDKMAERNDNLELELMDLFSKYIIGVNANLAFGVESEPFEDDKCGAFREAVRAMFEPTLMQSVMQMLILLFPSAGILLKIRLLPQNIGLFFRRVIEDILVFRERQGVERKDFLQWMMRLRETGARDCVSGKEFNVDSITAHATTFFDDGYETSTVTLSFISHLLATHPKVQQRLREEVNVVTARNDGLTYKAIQEMAYMDQIFNEGLRMFPPTGAMMKVCTKETDLIGQDGLSCHVTPGTKVAISIQGLHKDPLFWPNPEKFDPDRFFEERKKFQHKFVHLPFGAGPRSCVGMQMAIMNTKAAIATIVQNYVLETSPKTKLPIQFNPKYDSTIAKGGLWVSLNPI